MKPFVKFICICLLCCCLCNDLTAQTSEIPDTLLNKRELIIPPLQDLIDSALKHNAAVKYRNLDIDIKESNLESQRNYWLKNVGIQGDTRYGNIDAFSSTSNGPSASSSKTKNSQFNYGVGIYIKLPIFDMVNRKTQITQARAELEQAKSMAEVQQDEIRQLVIKQYEEILLKQKLLSIKSQNLGSATVNMEMVEKEFRNGIIPIAEYVRLSDMTARIQTDYEMAKSEFMLTKKILEDIVGFTFSNTVLREKK